MSKLLEDEKVASLVARKTAQAAKAENKRVLEIVKNHAQFAKLIEDKSKRDAVVSAIKELTTDLKAAA